MNVHWTKTAEDHLDAIYSFIAQDSELYAQRTIDTLTQCLKKICRYPRSGRQVPEYDTEQVREVVKQGYRINYDIRSDRIDIVAVIHAARDVLKGEILE